MTDAFKDCKTKYAPYYIIQCYVAIMHTFRKIFFHGTGVSIGTQFVWTSLGNTLLLGLTRPHSMEFNAL